MNFFKFISNQKTLIFLKIETFIIFIISFLFASQIAEAQDYKMVQRSVGTEDGLSSRNYSALFMDSQGLVWLSGDYGVDVFDGYRIENYSTDEGLDIAVVTGISEDIQGRIWFKGPGSSTNDADRILVLKKAEKRFYDIEELYPEVPFSQTTVCDIFSLNGKPGVWLVTGNLVYVEQPNGSFKEIYRADSDISQLERGHTSLWIKHDNTYVRLSPDGKVLDRIVLPLSKSFSSLGLDSSDNLYYFELEEIEGIYRRKVYQNNKLWHPGFWDKRQLLGVDPWQDRLWISNLGNGSFEVRDTSLQLLAVTDQKEFPYKPYGCCFFDTFGNVWRNQDQQMIIANLAPVLFKNQITNLEVFGEIGFGSRGLHFANDSVLFANGLAGTAVINTRSGDYRFLTMPDRLPYSRPSQIFSLKRLAIAEDKEGQLWFSNEGERIFNYDLRKGFGPLIESEYEIFDPANGEPRERLDFNWAIHFDKTGRMLIGQAQGMACLSPGDSVYKEFTGYNDYSELADSGVIDFYEDERGIWIASTTGLYLMDTDKGIIDRFHTQGPTGKRLPHNQLVFVTANQEGELWIASRGGGIFLLNPQNGHYEQWTTANGLSHDVTYAVYEDNYGKAWIPTNNGITRLNPENGETNIYLEKDGLSHQEFNTISHARAPDGRIAFGNLNGVTIFNPLDFELLESRSPELVTTGLSVQSGTNGEFHNALPTLIDSETIFIHPSDISFVINFSMLDYINSGINLFSYKIEGLDNDWTFLDKPELRMNRLPYGTFKLRVRGQGKRGIWSREKILTLKILRPFYLEWWFFVVIVILLIVVIRTLMLYRERQLILTQKKLESEVAARTKQIRQQTKELESLDKLKSQFFANISHELRTPLSLISAPLEKALETDDLENGLREDLKLASKNTRSVEQLVNEILDLNRLESGVAQPRYATVEINPFFHTLFDNFTSKANGQKISYNFISQIDKEITWILDPRMTEKIINNLVANALRHTPPGGEINVTIELDSELIVTVEDTGSGIRQDDLPYIFDRFFQSKDPNKKAEGGTGIGLALSNELAQVMNGSLEAQSQPGAGSVFRLRLPEVSIGENVRPVEEQTDGFSLGPTLPDLRQRILLVEDNDDMRQFISRNLSSVFDLETAADGQEALTMLKNNNPKPNLIISDLMMPVIDGMELLQRIRSDQDTANIPVIFLTARSAEKDKLAAFRLGVDDYLVKPFSLQELKARIKNQLRTGELRRLANLSEEPEGVDPGPADDWLLKVRKLTEENAGKVDFNVNTIASSLGESERNFFRKLKKATGYAPSIYLKEIRLQMARTYLENRSMAQVSEVSLAVGFTSVKYFSRQYKERFGKPPSEYLK